MERDIGTPLEWVGVAHYNSEYPHVHVALRGIGAEGRLLNLSRDYATDYFSNPVIQDASGAGASDCLRRGNDIWAAAITPPAE